MSTTQPPSTAPRDSRTRLLSVLSAYDEEPSLTRWGDVDVAFKAVREESTLPFASVLPSSIDPSDPTGRQELQQIVFMHYGYAADEFKTTAEGCKTLLLRRVQAVRALLDGMTYGFGVDVSEIDLDGLEAVKSLRNEFERCNSVGTLLTKIIAKGKSGGMATEEMQRYETVLDDLTFCMGEQQGIANGEGDGMIVEVLSDEGTIIACDI